VEISEYEECEDKIAGSDKNLEEKIFIDFGRKRGEKRQKKTTEKS